MLEKSVICGSKKYLMECSFNFKVEWNEQLKMCLSTMHVISTQCKAQIDKNCPLYSRYR